MNRKVPDVAEDLTCDTSEDATAGSSPAVNTTTTRGRSHVMFAIGALLGCITTLLALAIRRAMTLAPHCGWCATVSNWPTSRHDALLCRGYVQDRRRELLRDTRHGRLVEAPNPWGEMYLLDEEVARRAEVEATSIMATTAVGDFVRTLAELADAMGIRLIRRAPYL
ncbi:hypothetical protein ACIA78_21745 [Streptomyces xanthochromogenes]|uniref:hypothetical protein n=1 Tax=Streptomyces xanthochromogenes TaxID=67384 RepID=UPI0037AFA9A7